MRYKIGLFLTLAFIATQGFCGYFDWCFFGEESSTQDNKKENTDTNRAQFNLAVEKGDMNLFRETLPNMDITHAMIYVVDFGTVEMLREILPLGADVDCMLVWKNKKCHGTALSKACYDGDIAMAETLVNEGKADVNLADPDHRGSTPLSFAVVNDRRWLIKFLVEKGAEVSSLIIEKAKIYSPNMVEFLRENARTFVTVEGRRYDVLLSTTETEKALYQAITEEDFEKFRQIVSELGDPAEALRIVAMKGSVEHLQVVLDGDMSVNKFIDYSSDSLTTPLYTAVLFENIDIVQSLVLEGGAEVDLPTFDFFSTALSLAIKLENYDICAFLLEQGADPRKLCRVKDSYYEPIFVARAMENPKIIELLKNYLN